MPAKLPKNIKVKYLKYLDELRKSGVTNMFGAGPYLMSEFGLDRKMAHDVLAFWMISFDECHPKKVGE